MSQDQNPPSAGGKKPRGFAAMTPQRRAEIASMGGRTAHLKGTAHVFNSAEAKLAGAKGAAARTRNRTGGA